MKKQKPTKLDAMKQSLLVSIKELQEENRRLRDQMGPKNVEEPPSINEYMDRVFQGGTSYGLTGAMLGKASSLAVRNPVSYRYDILDADFWKFMAVVAAFGAKKYGDFNWQKSRLTGEHSPVNHAADHLNQYQRGEVYDHKELGEDPKFHLIAVAFNCMMEFWYENHFR